jgi:CBS domain-containing protein
VRHAMIWEGATTHPEATLEHADRVMFYGRFGSLPVSDGTRRVGVLTERDPLKAMSLLMPEPPLDVEGFSVTGGAMMHPEIGEVAGVVWRHLEAHKASDPVFLLAVGWLASPGKGPARAGRPEPAHRVDRAMNRGVEHGVLAPAWVGAEGLAGAGSGLTRGARSARRPPPEPPEPEPPKPPQPPGPPHPDPDRRRRGDHDRTSGVAQACIAFHADRGRNGNATDDGRWADGAVEIEGRDTDDLFETAGMALGAHGRIRDGQGVDRAAVVDLHLLEISRKVISLILIGNTRVEVRDEDYPPD